MWARTRALWNEGPSLKEMGVLCVAAAGALILRFEVLAPVFARAAGFIPFDLQPHLNRGMLVIQLGAARLANITPLYVTFAVADTLVSLVIAVFLAFFWQWLFLKAPNAFFTFLAGGGIALLPPVVAALEVAEHVVVFRLLTTGRDSYAHAIETTVSLHNIKTALLEVRNAVALIFGGVALVLWVLRRLRPPLR